MRPAGYHVEVAKGTVLRNWNLQETKQRLPRCTDILECLLLLLGLVDPVSLRVCLSQAPAIATGGGLFTLPLDLAADVTLSNNVGTDRAATWCCGFF